MLLLPEIIKKITASPLFGHGLGDTVTAFNPTTQKYFSTPHFDWGYLEIIDETGLVGAIIWLTLIAYLFWRGLKKSGNDRPIYTAILGAFLMMNITSPALFHVYGFITLSVIAASVRVSPIPGAGLPGIGALPLSPTADDKKNAAASG
jgi:O-antigen ligase